MTETIAAAWNMGVVYFFYAVTVILILMLAVSAIFIVIWTFNWPVFIFAGTAVGGLLLSIVYAWFCVSYYKAYFDWLPKLHGVVAANRIKNINGQASLVPLPAEVLERAGFLPVGRTHESPATQEQNRALGTNEDELDRLIETIQKREQKEK